MKLGQLVRVVRAGMEKAALKETQDWSRTADSQSDPIKKSVYKQVASAVESAVRATIDAGIESLLDDYDLESASINVSESRPVKSIEIESVVNDLIEEDEHVQSIKPVQVNPRRAKSKISENARSCS